MPSLRDYWVYFVALTGVILCQFAAFIVAAAILIAVGFGLLKLIVWGMGFVQDHRKKKTLTA